MKKWLRRIGIWLGVCFLVAVEVGACSSVGGQAEMHRNGQIEDLQLN